MTAPPTDPAPPGPVPVPRKLSEVLAELGADGGAAIRLGEIASRLWDRSFAALMVVFATPALLPLPGISMAMGLPLIVVTFQLFAGYPRVWLPRMLSDRTLDATAFERMRARLHPWLDRFERLARPRLWPFTMGAADRLAGGVALVMAILMFLPIPFANNLPAVAIILTGLGLGARDGLWLAAGFAAAAISVGVVVGIYGAGLLALAQVL